MIYLGADHRGFNLKESIKNYLQSNNIDYTDCGTNSIEIAHYPEIAKSLLKQMDPKKDKAILICGSGIGMCMVANKFKGIRAGMCDSIEAAKDGKQHSDLNVLVLPGDFIDNDLAFKITQTWLNSRFLDGRYKTRLEMITQIEKENFK